MACQTSRPVQPRTVKQNACNPAVIVAAVEDCYRPPERTQCPALEGTSLTSKLYRGGFLCIRVDVLSLRSVNGPFEGQPAPAVPSRCASRGPYWGGVSISALPGSRPTTRPGSWRSSRTTLHGQCRWLRATPRINIRSRFTWPNPDCVIDHK